MHQSKRGGPGKVDLGRSGPAILSYRIIEVSRMCAKEKVGKERQVLTNFPRS
jgi:hypothetical protein